MYIEWTKHLDTEQDKAKFSEGLQRSKFVLDRLRDILGERDTQANSKALGQSAYENTNWPLIQADTIGYRRALADIAKLVNLDQQKVDFNDR